jgi:hypothetical protein
LGPEWDGTKKGAMSRMNDIFFKFPGEMEEN